jgi:hypothetical protein
MSTTDAIQYRGAVLYADFSDSSPGEMSESPILYNERRELSAFVDRNGGQTIEAGPRRLTGLFPRSALALETAQQVRNHVQQLRESLSGRRGLCCRLLLGFGDVTLENGRMRSDWTHRLPGIVSQVPENAIAGLEDYVRNLAPTQELRKLGASDEDLDNRQTRHASTLLKADNAVFSELRISVGGTPRVIRSGECPLLLGRDKTCGIVVSGDTASRVHGRVLHVAGKFFYADESRNGTYVLTAAGEEIFLHQERVVLLGEGAISPGAPLSRQTTAIVRYSCSSSRLAMADKDGDTKPMGRKGP